MGFRIYDDDDNPMMRIDVRGHVIKFGVRAVEEDSRQWLGETLERQINDAINTERNKTLFAYQKELRRLLGIEK